MATTTTTLAMVNAAPVEAPAIVDNTNPLRQFRTYSYQFFIIACESTDVLNYLTSASNASFERPTSGNPRQLISTPVGNYVIVIDSRHDVDFIIEEVQWGTTFVGLPNSSRSTVALNTVMTDGTMTILEPRGVNFLNVLANLGDQLDVDMICMPYMFKVNFYGHMEDGTVIALPPTIPLGFIPVDIKGSVDERGTSYNMDICGIVNGIGYNPSFNSVVDGIGFNINPKNNLAGVLADFTQQLNNRYQQQRTQVINDFKGKVDLSGAANIIYTIMLEPGSEQLQFLSDFGTNIDEHYATGDSRYIITGTKEGGVAEVILKLLNSSTKWMQVAAEGDPPDATNIDQTNKRYTFKVTTEFQKTSTSTGSNLINVLIYVSEYRYETVDVVATAGGSRTVQQVPKIDPSQVIVFDYIFTGRNVDILHMDLNLSMGLQLLQTLATAKALSSQRDDVTGGQAPLPNKVPAAAPAAGALNIRGVVRKGTPIFAPLQWQNDYLKEMRSVQDSATADAVWRNFAGYQSVNTAITIHGNPILLGRLVNPDRSVPNYVKVNIKMPSTPDDIWEYDLSNNSTPGGYYKDFWFNGYYLLLSATNKFRDGVFTQDLDLISLPQTANSEGQVASTETQVDQNVNARQFLTPTAAQTTPTSTTTPSGDVTPASTASTTGSVASPTSAPSSGPAAFVAANWNNALQASQASGIDPDFLLAQAALETGYGTNTLSTFSNFFSIKSFGSPNSYWTGAVTTTPMTTGKPYRAYSDGTNGFSDQTLLLQRLYPVSASAPMGSSGINQYANGLQQGTGGRMFAEDPNYPSKVISTYNAIQGLKTQLGIVNNTFYGTPPSSTTPQQGPYLAQNTATSSAGTTNIINTGFATDRTVAQASIDQKTPRV